MGELLKVSKLKDRGQPVAKISSSVIASMGELARQRATDTLAALLNPQQLNASGSQREVTIINRSLPQQRVLFANGRGNGEGDDNGGNGGNGEEKKPMPDLPKREPGQGPTPEGAPPGQKPPGKK